MAKGIRSYGPGKFDTVIDSYAYEITLDGGADEEASYGEGGGWYGVVWLDDNTRDRIIEIAVEDEDPLTEEEEDLLDENVAVIFFERSDGIVETDWFENRQEALEEWAEIQEEFEEGDD